MFPLPSVVMDDEGPVSVQGRLKRCVSFWESSLEASEFVLGILYSGYRLPFITFPPSACMRSHHSALESVALVSSSIHESLQSNCIIEHDQGLIELP